MLSEGAYFGITIRKVIVRMGISFCVFMSLTECVCYIVFFHYIFHHDNKVAAQVLSQSNLNKRNKNSAISMAGQALILLTEFWYICLIGIMSTFIQRDLLRELAAVIKIGDFLIIPYIHTLTSSPIKSFIKQHQN